MQNKLEERQLEVERDILDMGVNKLKSIASECLLGIRSSWLHTYVIDLVWPLSDIISSEHSVNSSLKRKRPTLYYVIEDCFDPFAIAVCSLNGIIKSAIQGKVQLSTISEEVGRNVSGYLSKPLDKFKRVRIGVNILNMLFKAKPGLFDVSKDKDTNGNDAYVVVFNETSTLKTIKKCISLILGRYSPMLVKPIDWTSIYHGGYINRSLSTKTGLVRKRSSKRYEDTYSYDNMPDVYDSLNYLQSTPFKINNYILDVFRKCISKGIVVDNLPESKPIKMYKYPLPKGLKKTDMSEDQLITLRKWVSINKHLGKEKQRYNSKMFTIKVVTNIASELQEYDRFFFPHNMDYRGRIYPIPVIFNLQGLDYIRGILLFADGKPIGSQSGADWLAIHGANCYGQDKISFKDRIKWVKDNVDNIHNSYTDPLNCKFWREAKDPFQFLAFCKEWEGFTKFGMDYVCNLPIGVDATCSGLQHYSAMLKDPVGGKFVNLLPSDKPQDIYQEVANRLIYILEKLAASGSMEAKEWLNVGINRKATKRVVMTTVYSLTKYKSRDYIQEFLLDVAPNHFTDPSKACAWLADHLWDAVGDVIKGARVAMDYIKDTTKSLAKREDGIEWKVPSGFSVSQKCTSMQKKRIDLVWEGKDFQMTINDNSDKVDTRAQSNAICPNVIHSLDACHLMMVLNRSKEMGITHFASIHDCFYVHPSHVSLLSKIIRESFVDMYSDTNFLEDFKLFLEDKYKISLSDVPEDESFNLDIKQVLNSEYFFS